MAVAWRYGFQLFWKGIIKLDAVKISGALPLILPNPSLGANFTVIGLLASLLVFWLEGGLSLVWWYAALLVGQGSLFLVGVFYTQDKFASLASLFVAPAFLAWKLAIDGLSALGIGRKVWVRTERKL